LTDAAAGSSVSRRGQLIRTRSFRSIAALCTALAVLVGAVCALALPDGVAQWVLIVAIGIAAAAPLVVRVARHEFDVFEPVTFVAFAFLLLFVARPAYNLAERYSYFEVDLWSKYPAVLLGAFVSICALQLAYHSPLPGRIAAVLPSSHPRSERAIIWAASVLTVGAYAAVLVNAHLRGGLDQLLGNREETGINEVPPFIREAFMVALPATMLFLAVPGPVRRPMRLLALFPLGAIALMSLPGGDRRYLLPLMIALTTFYFLRRGRRPRVGLLVVLVVALLVFVIDPLRSVRVGDETYTGAVAQNVKHPLEPFTTLIRTGDTSMVDSFALQVGLMGDKRTIVIPWQVPERFHNFAPADSPQPFRHGMETVNDTILAPIPRQIWPGKPRKVGTLLIDRIYGTTPSGACIGGCPSFGFIGEAYADFGFWSIAALSAVFGLGLATGYRYLLRFRDDLLVQAAYASGVWLAFQPWEGGMSIIMHSFILTVIPILLVAWTSGRRSPAVRMASPSAASAD
jgi:hypothetical protein